jgi:hypothetical protein
MEFHVNDVRVQFTEVCNECGYKQDAAVQIPVIDLVNSGTPICQECGEDLEIEEYVSATRSNRTSFTDGDLDDIAQDICEGLDFRDTADICFDHVRDTLNYADDKYLHEVYDK